MNAKTQTLEETRDTLEEIRDQMDDLMARAEETLRAARGELGVIFRRAEVYWLAHINAALESGEGSMCSMEDTINEITELMDGDDGDEGEDE
jgi:hypothetical protein